MSSVLVAAVSDRKVNELWWVNMLEATLALFFGLSAVFWPTLTLLTLVYLFSGFVLVLGIVQLFSAIMSIRTRSTWWITGLLGVLGIGLGVYLLRHTNVSFTSFVILVGLLLLARGLLDLVRVFTDRATTREGVPKTLMAIMGIAAIVAGIFIMVQPASGGIAFVWALGLYAIVVGVLNMAVAAELRTALLEDKIEATADRLRHEGIAADDRAETDHTREPRIRRKPGAQPT